MSPSSICVLINPPSRMPASVEKSIKLVVCLCPHKCLPPPATQAPVEADRELNVFDSMDHTKPSLHRCALSPLYQLHLCAHLWQSCASMPMHTRASSCEPASLSFPPTLSLTHSPARSPARSGERPVARPSSPAPALPLARPARSPARPLARTLGPPTRPQALPRRYRRGQELRKKNVKKSRTPTIEDPG